MSDTAVNKLSRTETYLMEMVLALTISNVLPTLWMLLQTTSWVELNNPLGSRLLQAPLLTSSVVMLKTYPNPTYRF